MALQNCKTNSESSQYSDSRVWLTLPQRKGAKQRNKPLVNKYTKSHLENKTTGGEDCLNLRTPCKLKLPYFIERGADQAAALERQKKKTLPTIQPPGETMKKHLLKYQHQDWMLEE
jgi:hypothetical protein